MERQATIDFEAFKSSQTHLVVFRSGLVAVSKIAYDEALVKNVGSMAGHALTLALGPVGLFLALAAQAEDLHRDPPKAPVIEPVGLEDLLAAGEPTALVHGQVPKDWRMRSSWPAVEWFRPVLVFPRSTL